MERETTHGKYYSRTDNADIDKATIHQWLSSSSLKGECGDFILAVQDQSIFTRAWQSRILNNGADTNCKLYTQSEETVDHTVLAWSTIVNTEYFQRHNQVASFVHWIIRQDFKLPPTEKWYEHKPLPVIKAHK